MYHDRRLSCISAYGYKMRGMYTNTVCCVWWEHNARDRSCLVIRYEHNKESPKDRDKKQNQRSSSSTLSSFLSQPPTSQLQFGW